MSLQLEIPTLTNQFDYFPGTRYMGSKNKIIGDLWKVLRTYEFESFYDAFAGSNIVGYFMKCQGKKIISNDFMAMSYHTANAIIENSFVQLEESEIDFLVNRDNSNNFISKKFKGLYFSDSDNHFLDQVRANIDLLDNDYKKSIALSSLSRACIKKRPRGIFTFIGHRYDDGRKDIQDSLKEHFLNNISIFNAAVFDNGYDNKSFNTQTQKLEIGADLVYLDPPYYSQKSDNDYVRRYHFVEGLVKNWEGLEIQENTKTKKFKSYKSPFSNKINAYDEFDKLFAKFSNSIIAVSYSSNSLPTKEELTEILKGHKKSVSVHEIDHTYSFGTQPHKIGNVNNRVKEYLFIGE
ncbi:MAG: DNA adenine methylase [Candidatus Delongbacteria bacterium]|nr:DNA adenine methylase [Candidatus Delongbacteria bacterium]